MCHHCNTYAEKALGECLFCRLNTLSYFVFCRRKAEQAGPCREGVLLWLRERCEQKRA